ncbi:hypothetical protein ACJ2_28690 [Pantoea sp. QMID2]|nr:hypothetical protein ACJ1_32110 [Pantoea sp. QMID1]GME43231.1 hypothetical protein ACJ3_32290 [Pantoea sp. QMID3]GME58081.1 hypothetical protein ACJ4_28620 [Pantoea sp. QMID4]GME59466.1 hypothetical protein ACJ2_28690 [Pantoea sp. QMID2]
MTAAALSQRDADPAAVATRSVISTQTCAIPPSTNRSVTLIKLAASDARKATVMATSLMNYVTGTGW